MPKWRRKSNSDLSKSDLNLEYQLKAKNIHIGNEIFEIIWFSYRKNFFPSVIKNLTSDSGWGCMIRTGQMMLMTVLKRLIDEPFFRIIGMFFYYF